MDDSVVLPFEAGQLAESKSFKTGFRGAWFRCKIMRTFKREYSLDFYDFSEERVRWTRLYQKPDRFGKSNYTELMLRPQYPPIYNENEVPDANTISEVIVVKNDAWKVGDQVDWFADGCYWSGTITKILTKEEVQIKLLPPPAGEGLTYDVCCKDMRPSLDWSLEHGWTVSIFKGGENLTPCARLIKPIGKGPQGLDTDGGTKGFQSIVGSSASFGSSRIRDASARTNDDDDASCNGVVKRMRTDDGFLLNSTQSDTLEATVLDLEEILNKVKWLKAILQQGKTLSDARRPPWKFLSHQPSSMPK